jgi:hypothetical protein
VRSCRVSCSLPSRGADEDAETSVVLLQAEGRSFCAGYDISAKEPGTDDWRSNPTKAHQHLSVQLDFEMTPLDHEKAGDRVISWLKSREAIEFLEQ